MSTKFFTNANENTLLEKFKGVFTYANVHEFDVLVGFFRSSGYFRIREYLRGVNKIRILVGIDVDYLMSEAARKGLEFKFNANETRDEFFTLLKEDIQEADYDKDVEEGIVEFINDVIDGKIEVKAHPDKNIHAKIYIFRPNPFNEHNSGSVITGSSNLSISGIEKNFEFNVELRDFDDVVFATKTFEDLWKEAIDIEPETFKRAKKETYINDQFTPFEIYIKLLIEYFGESIEYDPESVEDLPKGYFKLRYQVDAVNDGYQKLMKHNGFILADVVGLGKTIVATQIAKKFFWRNGARTHTLVVYPPPLEQNWKKTFHDFDVPGKIDFITNGSLHKVKHPEDYDLIIVDEAHKFRSDESEMFHQLQKLCKTPRRRPAPDGNIEKKVILVTATPLNNKPEDIRNQLYLFQDAKKSTLEIGNLQHFFRPLIDRYRRLKKEHDRAKIAFEVKEIYEEIRIKVLEPLIVRRTRTDIRLTEEYWEDLNQQGVTFPNIEPPRQILYQLDPELDQLFDYTIQMLRDTKVGLKYYRYQAIRFLAPELRDQYKQPEMISELLAAIIKTLLVKRIDSSFHAFKMSLSRYLQANAAMIKMFENDRIYFAPKLNVNEYIHLENEEELIEMLEESDDPNLIKMYSRADFDVEYLEGLRHDQQIIDELWNRWNKVDRDPKLDEFINRIQNELLEKDINDNGKLVVFSESKETTEYISKQLQKQGIGDILAVDGSNANRLNEIISDNFDANINITRQRDEFNILITTEVMAEGVNLHRSNIVVNYDIPWNATRLMQRIGRVNRIGTNAETIYIYNFFPTAQADSEIELNKKAYLKLQGFHSALGEDSQIYSREEEFESFGLFEKVPEEERDKRLIYLSELRKFRDQNKEEYKRIQKMPKRARCGRKEKTRDLDTITFIKDQYRDSFLYMKDEKEVEELTFVEAANIFNARVTEKPITLHQKHYHHIQKALETFREESFMQKIGDRVLAKMGPNEKRALAFINNFHQLDFIHQEEKEVIVLAKDAIRIGKFQKLPREVNKLIKTIKQNGSMKPADQLESLMKILNLYPLVDIKREIDSQPLKTLNIKDKKDIPAIIISESFV